MYYEQIEDGLSFADLIRIVADSKDSFESSPHTFKICKCRYAKTVQKSIKTAGQTVKTLERTARTAIKTSRQAAKTTEQTVKATKKAAEAAKKSAQAAGSPLSLL